MRLRLLLAVLVILGVSGSALAHPGSAIAVGRDGRVYFVDTGGGVFEIGRDGKLSRRDGPAFHWMALDATSRFSKTTWPAIPGSEIKSTGLNPTVILSSDFPVAIGGDGAFYYPQVESGKPPQIIRVTTSGSRTVHRTLPPEPTTWVNGLAAGPDGSLYYTHDRTLRKIDGLGAVTTIAANVKVPGCIAIPGIEPVAQPYLRGLDVAADGTVYVAAAGCAAVLKITPAGRVTPILRTKSPYSPTAVAVANGEVYVLEYLHTASDNRREWLARVRKVTRDGKVVTLANVQR